MAIALGILGRSPINVLMQNLATAPGAATHPWVWSSVSHHP
ncbi:hypothetical protein [Prochlorothrix hollandica]|nr:hypothetical protein [Prochlorothrix hollandica]